MNHKYLMLIRRELWEHRSLWIAPLIAAGLIIVSLVAGQFRIGEEAIQLNGRGFGAELHMDQVERGGAMALMGIFFFLDAIASLVILTYLLDCLFAERKDRSILFWKSLPVSDTETVLAKMAVATVVIPLLVLVIAVLLQPILAAITWLRFEGLRPFVGTALVGGVGHAFGRLLVVWVFAVLWYLPVVTYLMLASVAAKRAPIMYAALPPFALFLAEKIMFGSGSNYVGRFVGERLMPWPTRLQNLYTEGTGGNGDGHWWMLFSDAKLWLGLVVAAGMLYIIIRLRRFRDDT